MSTRAARPPTRPLIALPVALPVALLAAPTGALLGAALVWLARPAPPDCTTLDGGLRSCMPIYVVGPAWWVYVVASVLGALVVGAAAAWCATVVRRPR